MDSSASCRIIVVSSSLDTSRQVAERIKALAGDTSDVPANSEVIHWTIKNKYYTAPVHFHPIHLEGLESIDLDDVPAVIYAWNGQEPYKEHIKQVSEHLSSYEPEVSLAIGLKPTTEEELEDFFFEHGFEYVEGHAHRDPVTSSEAQSIIDTPGMYRVVDALSTIMWPSMTRAEGSHHGKSHSGLSEQGADETDLALLALMNDAEMNGGVSWTKQEMEMLEQWLENDVEDQDHGYAPLPADSHPSNTPNVKTDDPWKMEPSISRANEVLTVSGSDGFDDDFTDFVTAPMASQTSDAKPDDDQELPSKADIIATSAKIFGASASSSLNLLNSNSRNLSEYSPLDDLAEPEIGRELDIDAPTFDLSRILGALEGMKEEISQISDEQERRKAAAKVALGLVYGLEGTSDDLDFSV